MILESEMDYYTMLKRIDSHVCGQCGGGLSVAWGGMWKINQHVLRCVKDIEHTGIKEIKESQLSKAMRDTLKGRKTMDSKALMALDKPGMLERIKQAKWPKALQPEEKEAIAVISMAYGLDPLLNEIMVYQGQPYPTSAARYRKAQESMLFDGIDSRPANKTEREDRNAKEGDYLYRCEVWRKGSSHPFVGWGRVRVAEVTKAKESRGADFLPIANDPDRMAEKRAEMMAIKKAFSLPIPFTTWEEASQQIIDAEYYEVKDVGKVGKDTGEIQEEPEGKEKPLSAVQITTVSEEKKTLAELRDEAQDPEAEVTPDDTSLEVLEEPAEKDETTITKAQIDKLYARIKKDGITLIQLGTFCNDKNFGNEWKVVDMKALMAWQFFAVMKGINDGILHSGI